MSNFFAFETLDAYKASRSIVREVYTLIDTFPSKEDFALKSQIRRAIISVPSNIAEGSGRQHSKEQAHFYEIAYASLLETFCQLEIATDLGYLSETEFKKIGEKIKTTSKLIAGLRNACYRTIR